MPKQLFPSAAKAIFLISYGVIDVSFFKSILTVNIFLISYHQLFTMIPPATTLCTSKPSFTFSGKSTKITSKDSEPVSPTNSEKRVCFADSIGLSLVSIRLISPCRSDRRKLLLRHRNRRCNAVGSAGETVFVQSDTATRFFSCEFSQPIDTAPDFDERLNARLVCLERVLCSNFALLGTVKVKNLAYEKKVTVRVSFDCWETYRDVWADYVSTYPNNEADKFIFRISLPSQFAVGHRIEFAIRYLVQGQEFWDNNLTKNYSVSCLKVESDDYTVPAFNKLPALLEL